MKLKEKETKKTLTEAELSSELRRLDEEIFKIRFQTRFSSKQNPVRLRGLRRDRARLLTWISQRRATVRGQ